MSLEKLLVMNIAATLTQAAIGGQGSKLQVIDETIQDPSLRKLNLEDFEEFRIFYAAVKGALEDETSWPSPKISSGSLVPSAVQAAVPTIVSALAPLAAGNPFLAAVLTLVPKLLTQLTQGQQAPPPAAGPIPDPGSAPSTVTPAPAK